LQSFKVANAHLLGHFETLQHCNFETCTLLGARMPKSLTWDDAGDIGILLSETHPELDPLAVRFTDLHRYVTELPAFTGDPKASNEGKLEAIQMAWHEEVQDRTQG
jgi:FeS assembly protein IscX